jgi:hypothetical protein
MIRSELFFEDEILYWIVLNDEKRALIACIVKSMLLLIDEEQALMRSKL